MYISKVTVGRGQAIYLLRACGYVWRATGKQKKTRRNMSWMPVGRGQEPYSNENIRTRIHTYPLSRYGRSQAIYTIGAVN